MARACMRWLVPGALLLLGAVALARYQDDREDEKRVRQAAFAYYSSVVLGDVEGCARAAMAPFVVVRDGKPTIRTVEQLKATVEAVARRSQVANLSKEEKERIASNMLRVFDDADIRFIGRDTATVVFLLRPAAKSGEGDWLGELLLARSEGRWRVFGEITDSKPAPPMPDVELP